MPHIPHIPLPSQELIKVAMRMHVESGLLTINAAGQLYKVGACRQPVGLSLSLFSSPLFSSPSTPSHSVLSLTYL